MDAASPPVPTPAERAYFAAVGQAKAESMGLSAEERMRAGLAAMLRLNALRAERGLAPFAPAEPPDELGFYERARARDLLG